MLGTSYRSILQLFSDRVTMFYIKRPILSPTLLMAMQLLLFSFGVIKKQIRFSHERNAAISHKMLHIEHGSAVLSF